MARERKVKVQHAGAEIEITVPEGWLHKDDVAETHTENEKFEAELKRRLASITKDLAKPDDLLKDEAFLKRVAEAQKEKLIEFLGLKPGKQETDVAKIRTELLEQFRRDELKPTADKLTAAETEIGDLRTRTLRGEIAASAIDPAIRVRPGLIDLVEIHVMQHMGWDPERKEHFVKKADGTGWELSSNPAQNGHPFKTAKEYLADLRKKGEKKDWFEEGTQPGPGYQGGPGGPSGSVVTLDQFKALTPAQRTNFFREHPTEYSQFQEQIRQAGENALFNPQSRIPAAKT